MIIKDFTKYANRFPEKLFYHRYKEKHSDQPGVKRLLEIPTSDEMMDLLRVCNKSFQQIIPCPPYNYAGYEGRNAYKNALAHVGNFAYVTMDLKDYYLSSKAEYVQDTLVKKFKVKGKELEFLMKILTHNGHLPTGSPTSTILAFLSHKELFDEIYEYTKALDIVFTLYADDITLSAKHGITMEVVNHIKEILAKHGLIINPSKTKFYNYKKALITGYYIHQSGKISVPYKIGHTVITMLKQKSIQEMSMEELRRIIGKINHIQYVDKKAFFATKRKACKQLSKLVKEQERKKKELKQWKNI